MKRELISRCKFIPRNEQPPRPRCGTRPPRQSMLEEILKPSRLGHKVEEQLVGVASPQRTMPPLVVGKVTASSMLSKRATVAWCKEKLEGAGSSERACMISRKAAFDVPLILTTLWSLANLHSEPSSIRCCFAALDFGAMLRRASKPLQPWMSSLCCTIN